MGKKINISSRQSFKTPSRMTATAFLKCPHCCLSKVVNSIIIEYFQVLLSQSSLHLKLLLIYQILFHVAITPSQFFKHSQVMTSSYVCIFPRQIFLWWPPTSVEMSVISVLPAKARQSFTFQMLFQDGISATWNIFLTFPCCPALS